MNRIKRFNENLEQEVILYNNKGELMLGNFKINQKGKSGSIYIKDINDVDWEKSTITYYNSIARTTYWTNISQESLNKLSDEVKELIWEADKKENFIKCSFYLQNDLAKIIHISPEFERVEEGGKIISYLDKLQY